MSEAAYAIGDLIEAVKGETVLRGRLDGSLNGIGVEEMGWPVNALERKGFTVTVIEKAKPPLDAEPGTVLRGVGANGSILFRRYPVNGHEPEGPWVSLAGVAYSDEAARAFFHDQFTKLEPVAETAKKITEWLWSKRDDIKASRDSDDVRGFLHGLDAEFEVTS